MPRGDRTGPQGMGPMTGRAAGYCAGYDAPGYANPIPGRGLGMGRGGRGRRAGYRWWWRSAGQDYGWNQPMPAPLTAPAAPAAPAAAPIDEKAALEQEIVGLKAELAYLEQRLNQLAGIQEESGK